MSPTEMSSDLSDNAHKARDPSPFYELDKAGNLNWTEEGLKTYRKRFARFGIRIQSITTFDEYCQAMHLSADAFWPDLIAGLNERCQGRPWHELLLTTLTGSEADIARAKQRFKMREKLKVMDTNVSTAPR